MVSRNNMAIISFIPGVLRGQGAARTRVMLVHRDFKWSLETPGTFSEDGMPFECPSPLFEVGQLRRPLALGQWGKQKAACASFCCRAHKPPNQVTRSSGAGVM